MIGIVLEEEAGKADLPVEIDVSETIVRVVVAHAHYDAKKDKVKTAVFRPRAPATSVSTIRQRCGDNFCKVKAKEIAAASSGQTYVGLLTITVAQIRSHGSTVSDSRDEFLGHADLDHGLPSPPDNDPAAAVDFQRMTERCQELLRSAVFNKDLDPADASWNGEPLMLASKMR